MDKTDKIDLPDLQNDPQAIKKLEADLKSLINDFYSNNFESRQDFTKYSNFNTRLKIPHYDAIPSTGETGELIESGGKLYICSAPNVFTVVGTQS